MKRKNRYLGSVVILIVILALSLTISFWLTKKENWYRIGQGAAKMNVITISNRTKEGFELSASCVNGAQLGEFRGYFSYVTETRATCAGKSANNELYCVTVDFKPEGMVVSVDSGSDEASEDLLLQFGAGVTLSGEYARTMPEFDYSDTVLEKVFHSDTELAQNVLDCLGETEYKRFVLDFGMCSIIEDVESSGHTVVRGILTGAGYSCWFSSDPSGYFYGIYNDRYFTNDPIFENNGTFTGFITTAILQTTQYLRITPHIICKYISDAVIEG